MSSAILKLDRTVAAIEKQHDAEQVNLMKFLSDLV
ncbi:hypothetical protein J2X56_003939 [Herbaspirillum sp. 1173]|nr:hypothetical protein [Herbaspirillum sp. 1173]